MNTRKKIVSATAGVIILLGLAGGTSLVLAAPPIQQPPGATQMNRAHLGFSLSDDTGTLVVKSVVANSPAAGAGLRVGDQVTAINGTAVSTVQSASQTLRSVTTGTSVSMSIVRSGSSQTLSMTAVEAPKPSYLGARTDDSSGKVVVSAVEASSPAATAGIQVGDQIVSVNGTAITSERQFHEVIRSLATGSTASIVVSRNNQNVTVSATLTQATAGRGGRGNGGQQGVPADGQGRRGANGAQPSGTPGAGNQATPPAGNQGTPPQGGQRGGGGF